MPRINILELLRLRTSPQLVWSCLSVCCWSAGLVEFIRFLSLVVYYFPVGINGDGVLYFAMGRGLLNGLQLYVDLFETKPPMVFWLAAFSLRLGGSDLTYRLIHAIGIGLIPVALTFQAVRLERTKGWLLTGLAFLFGSAMASFALSRSLGYQTEGFGIIPAVAAVLIFVQTQGVTRRSVWSISEIAICMALAVLWKEPFALSILAGMLLLIDSRCDLMEFTKASMLSLVFWLAVLVVTGTASSYFSLYLPEMLHGRVVDNALYHDYSRNSMLVIPAPVILRGLNIITLLRDMGTPPFRVVPEFRLLALALGVLMLVQPATLLRDGQRWTWSLCGAAAVSMFIVFTNLGFALDQVVSLLPFRTAWQDAFFRGQCLHLVFFTACWVGLMVLLLYCSRATALRVVLTCAALYLTSLAVAAGGDFSPHHFLFAVPLYVASFVSVLRLVTAHNFRGWPIAGMGIVSCLLILNAGDFHRFNIVELNAAKAAAGNSYTVTLPQARKLDVLLTTCGYARYFSVGESVAALPGVTKHSPYQLQYGLLRAESQRGKYFNGQEPNAAFHAKLLRDFAEADVLVTDENGAKSFPIPEFQDELQQKFSVTPPPCAQPYVPIEGLVLLFRSSPAI